MAHYKRMTIFQNLECIRTLKTFRKLVDRYFESVDYGSYGLTVVENSKAREIRSQLNLTSERAKRGLSSAEVSPDISDASRPTEAGKEEGLYLIDNIFNLHELKISPQTLLDYVERAIGVYRDDKFKSLIRTLNPLFWLSVVLDYMSSFPFAILGTLGFNRSKLENGSFGKFSKGCFRVAVVVTVLAVTLYDQGYLDAIEQEAHGFMSYLKVKGQEVTSYLQDSSRKITPEN